MYTVTHIEAKTLEAEFATLEQALEDVKTRWYDMYEIENTETKTKWRVNRAGHLMEQ